jgi:hypothetical protein
LAPLLNQGAVCSVESCIAAPVEAEAVSIVTFADEASRLLGSKRMSARQRAKRPLNGVSPLSSL